jgi:hypothetical protein
LLAAHLLAVKADGVDIPLVITELIWSAVYRPRMILIFSNAQTAKSNSGGAE